MMLYKVWFVTRGGCVFVRSLIISGSDFSVNLEQYKLEMDLLIKKSLDRIKFVC